MVLMAEVGIDQWQKGTVNSRVWLRSKQWESCGGDIVDLKNPPDHGLDWSQL